MWIYRDPRTTVSYRQETLIPPKVTLTVKSPVQSDLLTVS